MKINFLLKYNVSNKYDRTNLSYRTTIHQKHHREGIYISVESPGSRGTVSQQPLHEPCVPGSIPTGATYFLSKKNLIKIKIAKPKVLIYIKKSTKFKV